MKRWLVIASILGACAKPTAPSEPKDVSVAKVDGDAGAIQTVQTPDAGATKPAERPLEEGWITADYKTGRIEYVGREKALAALKQANMRLVVRVKKIIEECSSVGGSHVFVEAAYSKELPFDVAHFGGHGSHVVHSKGALFGDERQLYVAAIEAHPPSSFGNGRGWCLEDAPPYDADVLAIVPVRSEGEGMRLLTDLAK